MLNEVFKDADGISLPVPAGTRAGTPIRFGALNAVTITDEGSVVDTRHIVDGLAQPMGGIGNLPGFASAKTSGAFRLEITDAVTAQDSIYITNAGVLTTADAGNHLFGVAIRTKKADSTDVLVRLIQPGELPGYLSETELTATYAGSDDGILYGTNGKKYAFVAGAIRNVGGTDYWQPINDTGHSPVNIASVTTSTSQITVNFSVTGAKVITSSVVTDEVMAANAYFAGASVGLSSMNIWINRGTIADYIYYNGSSFVSAGSKMSPGTLSEGGTLTLTHDSIPGFGVSAMVRESPLAVAIGPGGPGATTTPLQFRDAAGTLLTTPMTDMKVFVTRSGQGTTNPQIALPPNHNLWVHAILELP
jgi:hypothetical protein